MMPPAKPLPADEFGSVEALEILRVSREGSQRPLLCRCDDNAVYVVKPFSSGGAWPQIAEWVCARLGRALQLPIPNYRQVLVSPELVEGWIATGGRFIEPGIGFGSQWIPDADECSPTLLACISSPDATRLLAFDWWIRNGDRVTRNPNLLWSHSTDRHYVIDHEKAGHAGTSVEFWRDHLFAQQKLWMTDDVLTTMRSTLPLLETISTELPSSWTGCTHGVEWFINHLVQSIENTPIKDWRLHE